jgi:hypothetical protein
MEYCHSCFGKYAHFKTVKTLNDSGGVVLRFWSNVTAFFNVVLYWPVCRWYRNNLCNVLSTPWQLAFMLYMTRNCVQRSRFNDKTICVATIWHVKLLYKSNNLSIYIYRISLLQPDKQFNLYSRIYCVLDAVLITMWQYEIKEIDATLLYT